MESKEELITTHVPTTSETKPDPVARPEDISSVADTKARVDAVWQQMNKGVSSKTLKSILNNHNTKNTKIVNKPTCQKGAQQQGWMTYLGLGSKTSPPSLALSSAERENNASVSDDAKKLAAAALSAVKDAAAAANSAASSRGKVEITEVRDFAGEEIEVKKFVDADSKGVPDKGKGPAGPSSAVDAVLEQIKKKPKLSVLDKTKKDWGEFKEENKGLEDELDAYKKSSNQYLDKVSFLQRADIREFERERDARLALHAKRKPDMREDL